MGFACAHTVEYSYTGIYLYDNCMLIPHPWPHIIIYCAHQSSAATVRYHESIATVYYSVNTIHDHDCLLPSI